MCVCVYTHARVGPAPPVLTTSGGLSRPWWHPGTGKVDTLASDLTLFTKMVPQEDELGRLLCGVPSPRGALAPGKAGEDRDPWQGSAHLHRRQACQGLLQLTVSAPSFPTRATHAAPWPVQKPPWLRPCAPTPDHRLLHLSGVCCTCMRLFSPTCPFA